MGEPAIQFMNNQSDGPCVLGRCKPSSTADLVPCKVNMDGNAAWNFRYIDGTRTSAVTSGDILVEKEAAAVVMCGPWHSDANAADYVRCTNIAGDEIGLFQVPEGADPYGP